MICLLLKVALLAVLPFAVAAPTQQSSNSSCVVVDLGYTLHEGRYEADPYGAAFYAFSNVQYATAKRFAEPQKPPTNRSIQTGSQRIQCAQTQPTWNDAEHDYENGQTPVWENITLTDTTAPASGTQEDCLLLDLVVPEAVLRRQTKAVPVIVYIHGGGYTAGDKAGDNPGSSASPPSFEGQGYMTRSNGSVIFVSLSYRLGIFGFLAGESYTQHAKTNLGLRDQRAALEWIQEHISAFNGDPSQVTLVGESAGGGSLMFQIIAYAGKKGTPFKRAIPQSPWHQPLTHQKQEEVYRYALQVANVSTFQELRELDFDTMYRVNDVVISNQYPFGLFNVGPVVDGDFVPDYYDHLLTGGRFNHDTHVMVGHNEDEGFIFASPLVKDEQSYVQWLRDVLTNASEKTIAYIADILYPANFDGTEGYTDWHGRMSAAIGDMSAACTAYEITHSYRRWANTKNYAYEWTLAPGWHAEDIAYTQYIEDFSSSTVNATLAVRFQTYIVNFAKTGNPNGAGLPYFPADALIQMDENFNASGMTVISDDTVTKRCLFWAGGAYRQ